MLDISPVDQKMCALQNNSHISSLIARARGDLNPTERAQALHEQHVFLLLEDVEQVEDRYALELRVAVFLDLFQPAHIHVY